MTDTKIAFLLRKPNGTGSPINTYHEKKKQEASNALKILFALGDPKFAVKKNG